MRVLSAATATAEHLEIVELSFGVATKTDTHPNRTGFRGVLVRLDEPSDKAPGGAHGHRIIVPSALAKERLTTLLGMGLNVAPDLDGHNQRHKIGLIENAWIEGKDLWVSGSLWTHDFPELKQDLKTPGLGMSMEIGKVDILDETQDIWTLKDFCFLGATILDRKKAAYHQTQAAIAAAAAAAKELEKRSEPVKLKTPIAASEDGNDKGKKPEGVDKATVSAIAKEALAEDLSDMRASISTQTDILAQLAGSVEMISAAIARKAGVLDPDEAEINAKKAKKGDTEDDEEDDDEDDMGSSIDKGSLDDLGDDEEDDDDTRPGHFNKSAKNKGSKTTTTGDIGKVINEARFAAQQKLQAQEVKELRKQNKRLESQLEEFRTKTQQLTAAAETSAKQLGRRSVALPSDLAGVLKRSNIDANELTASGEQLTNEEFDGMLTAAGVKDATRRIALKNKMGRAGFLESGIVDRGFFQVGQPQARQQQ